ncbi:MAG: ChbG/HpnK family deacetylase [bacterium]|nr:ChbG/HpnK family deacetylase [bacterium]
MSFGHIIATTIVILAGMPDQKRIVVNADDLALHPSVNRAICRAHLQGIITSTSILAGGPAFKEAVDSLKALPALGIGIHLCLVDQIPVSPPGMIPSLVDSEGRLHKSHSIFIKNYMLKKIDLGQVRIELNAQVRKVVETGLQPTHIDGHQHLHVLPAIADIVADISQNYGITRVRVPEESFGRYSAPASLARRARGKVLSMLARQARRRFASSGMKSTDHFFGFFTGGRMDKDAWIKLIPALKEGTTEIMVHPGQDDELLQAVTDWGYRWSDELAALCDPEIKSLLLAHGIKLINFGDLS